MSMTRDDVLRELELLPMWKLRSSVATSNLVEQATERNVPQVPAEQAAEVAEVLVVEPVMVKPTAQKIVKQWALIYPKPNVQDGECNLLINNIIKAMRLSSEDYVLLNEVQALAEYEVGDILLFGSTAANQYLQMSVSNLDDLRGKLHVVDNVRCWVTYHPEQMLVDPLLKRYVWQDICAAMPHLVKS